jgi:hypothetical protein
MVQTDRPHTTTQYGIPSRQTDHTPQYNTAQKYVIYMWNFYGKNRETR